MLITITKYFFFMESRKEMSHFIGSGNRRPWISSKLKELPKQCQTLWRELNISMNNKCAFDPASHLIQRDDDVDSKDLCNIYSLYFLQYYAKCCPSKALLAWRRKNTKEIVMQIPSDQFHIEIMRFVIFISFFLFWVKDEIGDRVQQTHDYQRLKEVGGSI